MKKANTFFWLSGVLYGSSVLCLCLLLVPATRTLLPFMWWIHLGVMVSFGAGGWESRRIGKKYSRVATSPAAIQPWQVLLGALVALLIVISIPDAIGPFALEKTPTGEAIHSVHPYEENGQYFVQLNKKYVQEISPAEYNELAASLHQFFAMGWAVFSYVCLLMWNSIRRRKAIETV